jgi:hypothetical protein
MTDTMRIVLRLGGKVVVLFAVHLGFLITNVFFWFALMFVRNGVFIVKIINEQATQQQSNDEIPSSYPLQLTLCAP